MKKIAKNINSKNKPKPRRSSQTRKSAAVRAIESAPKSESRRWKADMMDSDDKTKGAKEIRPRLESSMGPPSA